MGENKQKEKSVARWKKFVVVGACVLFVVLMIVSGMGTTWLSAFSSVKPGDVAVIDYTVYDAAGNPILTTNHAIFEQAVTQEKLLYSKQLSITANKSLTNPLFPVQVSSTGSGWDNQFALFQSEYDAISSGIVGMKVNGQKRITIPSSSSLTQLWSPEMLKRNGVSISEMTVGDVLIMAVSNNPEAMASNQSTLNYIRIGELTQKTDAGAVVDFGYPTMDIRVVSINGNN